MPNIEENISSYVDGAMVIPNSAYCRHNKSILKIINPFIKKGRMIDIGSWDGSFLEIARHNGWEVVGVDLNAEMCQAVERGKGIKMISGDAKDALDLYGADSFDVCTLFHVIEHLSEPLKDIRSMYSLLRPSGLLVVRTPNIDSIIFELLGRHWGHLALPAHVLFFSPVTLRAVLEKNGFEVLYMQTWTSPIANEIYELLKGIIKILTLRKHIDNSESVTIQRQYINKLVNKSNLVKIIFNKVTMPVYYILYPLWKYYEKRGRGTEIFVISRKIK